MLAGEGGENSWTRPEKDQKTPPPDERRRSEEDHGIDLFWIRRAPNVGSFGSEDGKARAAFLAEPWNAANPWLCQRSAWMPLSATRSLCCYHGNWLNEEEWLNGTGNRLVESRHSVFHTAIQLYN